MIPELKVASSPAHHYIEQITPAIRCAAGWWARALARCNGLSLNQTYVADEVVTAAIERHWRSGCDKDMCLWEEDMPPVIITATPTPGFFLIGCMETLANELRRDLVWRSRSLIEMRINVERVWLRLDGEVEVLWKARGGG